MYTHPSDVEIIGRVEEVAKSKGVPMSHIALAWVLGKQGVTSPIVGASKPHHLDDAIGSLDVKLTDEEVTRLEELYVPHRVLDHQ